MLLICMVSFTILLSKSLPQTPGTIELNMMRPRQRLPHVAIALEWYGRYYEYVTLQDILVIDVLSNSSEIVLRWIPQDITNYKSKLVQTMAWYRQATSQYLRQYWPRSLHMAPLGHVLRVIGCNICYCMSVSHRNCVSVTSFDPVQPRERNPKKP